MVPLSLLAQEAVTTVGFTVARDSVSELSRTVQLPVIRTGDTSIALTVDYTVEPLTALEQTDYQGASGSIAFEPGQTTQFITITIVDDALAEEEEELAIRLEPGVGYVVNPAELVVSIIDNDAGWSGLVSDFNFFTTNTVGINALFLARDHTIWFGGVGSPYAGGYGQIARDGSFLVPDQYALHQNARVFAIAEDREGAVIFAQEGAPVARVSVQNDYAFHIPVITGKAVNVFPQPDGSILLAGSFGPDTNATAFFRLDNQGGALPFNAVDSLHQRITAAVASGTNIIGSFQSTNDVSEVISRVGRWFLDGSRDSTFTTPLNDLLAEGSEITTITIHPTTGNLLLALRAADITQVFEMTTDGSTDTNSPIATIDGTVHTIAFTRELQETGSLVHSPIFGGEFTAINGVPAHNISGVSPGEGPNGPVRAILGEPTGNLLVGGHFTEFNGLAVSGLVRIRGSQADSSRSYVFWDNDLFHGFEKLESAELSLSRAGRIDLEQTIHLRITAAASLQSEIGINLDEDIPVTFQPGQTNRVIHVPLRNGAALEGKKRFTLSLSSDAPGILISRPAADLVVFDDESPGAPDPTFQNGPQQGYWAVARQHDGKLLVGYWVKGPMIARLNHDGTIDSSFVTNQLPALNWEHAYIRQIEQAPDGKIYVAGSFVAANTYSTNYIARLHADGTLDSTFNPRLNGGASVPPSLAFALHPDGKIVIASADVSGISGVSHQQNTSFRGLLRLLPDGSLDSSFGFSGFSRLSANAIAFDLQGRAIVAGYFTSVGTGRGGLHRFSATGSVDSDFPINMQGTANALVRSGNHLLVAGFIQKVNDRAVSNIFRLNLDTETLDETFVATADSTISKMLLLDDSRILIAGRFTKVNGKDRFRIAILHPDGTLDESFDPGLNLAPNGVAQLLDGRIVAAGYFTEVDRAPLPRLVRFEGTKSPGTLIFEPAQIEASEAQPSIRVSVKRIGGSQGLFPASLTTIAQSAIPGTDFVATNISFQFADGQAEAMLFEIPLLHNPAATGNRTFSVRLSAGDLEKHSTIVIQDEENGTFIPGFPEGLNTTANPAVTDFSVAADGSVLVTGHFKGVSGFPITNIARFDANLNLDTTFAPKVYANRTPFTAIIDAAGGVLVGGDFGSFGTNAQRLARLTPDLSLDLDFRRNSLNSAPSAVTGFLALEDGKFIGYGVNLLRRWNAAGSLDTTFVVNPIGLSTVAVYTNDTLIVGMRGAAPGFLGMRLVEANGTMSSTKNLRTEFQTGGSAAAVSVRSIRILPDGKLLVGGEFNEVNRTPASHIVRLNPDWTIDPTFNLLPITGVTGPNGQRVSVNAILPLPGGDILIAGRFSTIAGQPRQNLALISSDGHLRPGFNLSMTGNEIIELGLLQDGSVLARGDIYDVNGVVVPGLFRLAYSVPQPPVVMFTSPVDATAFESNDPVTISADAFDPDGLLSLVEITVADQTNRFTASPFRVHLGPLPPGTYTAHARAVDQTGLETIAAPINFTVNEPLPPVELRLAVSTAADQITFTFEASGRTYHLEATEDFVAWERVHTFTSAAGATSHTIEPNRQGRRFYRVAQE